MKRHGLALGGGGIKGIVTACVLQLLEQRTGKPCRELFHLMAGTSTGAELAIGLGLGIPARDLLHFYVEHGPAIFAKRLFHWELLRAKYDITVLEKHLDEAYGGRLFGECAVPVLACTTIYDGLRSEVLKSTTMREGGLPAAMAAAASSAAVPYFAPAIEDGVQYIDGGFWNNSPCFVGISEAKTLGWMDDGNTFTMSQILCPRPPAGPPESNYGLLGVAKNVADMFMDSGADAMARFSRTFIGEQFLNIEPTLGNASKAMDDASLMNLQALVETGRAAAPAAVDKIIALLGS